MKAVDVVEQVDEIEEKNNQHIQECEACRTHYSNLTFSESDSISTSNDGDEEVKQEDGGKG